MAGRPLTRATLAALTEIEGSVMDRIADGEAVTHLCRALDCSTTLFYKWLNDVPERRAYFDQVRELAAHKIVDDVDTLLADARKEGRDLTAAQSGIVKEQASHKRWLASRLNALYRDKVDVAHSVDLADAHLAALVKYGSREALDALDADDAIFTMLEDGSTPVEADYTLEEGTDDNA